MKILSHVWPSNAQKSLIKRNQFSRKLSGLLVTFLTIGLLAGATTVQANGNAEPSNTMVIVGDSLTSEYGIRRNTGWVQLLRDKMADSIANPPNVINASISGDTTSSGLTRLPALLKEYQPAIVLIELGGNDALRGLSLDMTRDNLTEMITLSQAAGAKVILAGMQIPPNYGPAYTKQFRDLFPEVAQQTNAQLVPFLLAGLELDRSLFIEDGIHPAEHAQPILLENVWAVLEPALAEWQAQKE